VRTAGRRRGPGALIFAALLAAGAATGAGPGGQPFRSEAGRFAVAFPGPPRYSSTSHATFAGPVRSAEYLVEAGPVELRVEIHDVPALAGLVLSDAALLRRAEGDLLGEEGAVEHRDEATQHQGYPAREVSYRLDPSDGRDGRALLVLVARRLYIAAALHPPGAGADPVLERFFASFEVWGAGS
jgi:hypothetical protein